VVTASPSSHTWLDGRQSVRAVPFGGNSMQHGTAVFDGIRCYRTPDGPALFRPREHVLRLLSSARILGIEHGYSFAAMMAAVTGAVEDSGLGDCYARPVLFAPEPLLGVDLHAFRFTLGVEVWPVPPPSAARVRLTVSPWRRPAATSFPATIKATGTYVVSALARTHAVSAGFDDAIQLDALSGRVAEATIANVFLVRDGMLLTPWTEDALLPGVTRDSILRLAEVLGISTREGPVELTALATAQEVFLTGTASELVGVRSVDDWAYLDDGPVFTALSRAFREMVTGRRRDEFDWCVPLAGTAAID
jgi:branched-chain amino acid aminotransferase